MKQIIAIILLFAVMVRPMTEVYYLVDYQLRKDYIATVLCINKDKPELHCNGMCYLAKKLKAIEEQEQKSQRIAFEKFQLPVVFCEEIQNMVFGHVLEKTEKSVYFYQNQYVSTITDSLFHPPSFA